MLWRCWLGGRKGIRPVKNWVVGCWRGHLSGARCRLAYGPAEATTTHCLCFNKIQIGFTFLVLAYPGRPGKRAVKRVYVSVLRLPGATLPNNTTPPLRPQGSAIRASHAGPPILIKDWRPAKWHPISSTSSQGLCLGQQVGIVVIGCDIGLFQQWPSEAGITPRVVCWLLLLFCYSCLLIQHSVLLETFVSKHFYALLRRACLQIPFWYYSVFCYEML